MNATSSSIVEVQANLAPTARLSALPTSGRAALPVLFDASASSDVDGQVVAYDWDFGDGQFGSGVALVACSIPWGAPSRVFSTGGNLSQVTGWVFLGLLAGREFGMWLRLRQAEFGTVSNKVLRPVMGAVSSSIIALGVLAALIYIDPFSALTAMASCPCNSGRVLARWAAWASIVLNSVQVFKPSTT